MKEKHWQEFISTVGRGHYAKCCQEYCTNNHLSERCLIELSDCHQKSHHNDPDRLPTPNGFRACPRVTMQIPSIKWFGGHDLHQSSTPGEDQGQHRPLKIAALNLAKVLDFNKHIGSRGILLQCDYPRKFISIPCLLRYDLQAIVLTSPTDNIHCPLQSSGTTVGGFRKSIWWPRFLHCCIITACCSIFLAEILSSNILLTEE